MTLLRNGTQKIDLDVLNVEPISKVVKELTGTCRSLLKAGLPASMLRLLARWRGNEYFPPRGRVDLGDLERQTPISRCWGFDRGLPIDRYYIEHFLNHHAADIRGRVLEIGDPYYTRLFGAGQVTQSDVLHVKEGNPLATLVGDLTKADHISSNAFDCVILTQTLHLIYDVRAALATLHRIIRPGGVLLATFPGISQIDHSLWKNSWYWAFTSLSARRLLEEAFSSLNVEVETYGNVLAASGFLYGLAVEDLRPEELDYHDPDYQILITVRAVKHCADDVNAEDFFRTL